MAAGLYVHVPFCPRRCGYCDFYAEVQDGTILQRSVEAILREAEIRGAGWRDGPFDSVFVGGGTPTHLGPELIVRLLGGLRERLPVAKGAEWTIEANPESADSATLDSALRAGANRLSLGVQSLDDASLAALGRLHNSFEAKAAVRRARAAGFGNLNIDLIYGLPLRMDPGGWESTLLEVLVLEPEHISCYLLTLEPHVRLAREWGGELKRPAVEARVADEYRTARQVLAAAGYQQYEISNWAMLGRFCRHNVNVWEGGVYLGLGPGAHGHHEQTRRANRADLSAYLDALEKGLDPPHEVEAIDERGRGEETVFLGLRMLEGIAWNRLEAAVGGRAAAVIRERAARWTRAGLLKDDGVRLRIGERGLLVSNALIADLLGSD